MKVLVSVLPNSMKTPSDAMQQPDSNQFQILLKKQNDDRQTGFIDTTNLTESEEPVAPEFMQSHDWLKSVEFAEAEIELKGGELPEVELAKIQQVESSDKQTDISDFYTFSIQSEIKLKNNDESVHQELAGKDAFQLSGSLHNIGNDQKDVKLLQQRLLPFGSIGNGYLSIIAHMIQTQTNESGIGSQSSVSLNTQSSQTAPQQGLFNNANQPAANTSVAMMSEMLHIMSNTTSAQKQFSNTTERVTAHFELSAIQGEIVKRFFLQTPGQAGNTFWYRDYDMNDTDKLVMAERLAKSEFAHNNNINKLIINGSLIWGLQNEQTVIENGRTS